MGTLFWCGPQVLARVGDWSKEPMIKGEQRGETPFHAWRCHHGLPRVGRSPEQIVWPRVALGGASKNHVLGPLLLHHGPTKEGGAGVQGVAQMRPDRLATTSGRGPKVEPSGGAVTRTPEKWLPPLPPYDGSPVVGE